MPSDSQQPAPEPAPSTPPEAVRVEVSPPPRVRRSSRSAPNDAGDAGARAQTSVDPALAPHLEAILVSVDRPLPALRLASGLGMLGEPTGQDGEEDNQPDKGLRQVACDHVAQLVELLNQQYAAGGRAFRVEAVAGGYRLMTLPDFAGTLARFHKDKAQAKLSRASIETLAIIAYKQPITKAELEAIRGVSCGEVLKTLLDRRLVTIKGRAEELGRPMLYGTTTQFLQQFGLASIKDLPQPGELKLT